MEVGAEDLAMSAEEASSLLEGAGVKPDDTSELVQRTEGWPTGLYVAALAVAGARQSEAGFTFTGDDRFMGDYLRSELLDRMGSEVSFLIRTAVLDRMCGSLCDAILGATAWGGSWSSWRAGICWWSRWIVAATGTGITTCSGSCCRRNSGGESLIWSRICTSGRPRGTRRTPSRRPRSRRAGGLSATARRGARLVLELAQPVWAGGRVVTVLRWMEWLRDATSAEHYGAIAVHGSLIFALLGHPSAAERWAAAAERVPSAEPSPTAARWRARWHICVRSCVATASTRCGATRRWPGKD